MYVELHSRSAFSFLEGSSLPENLIAACARLQMPAMALLDRDGVYGSARFHGAANIAGIKAHVGTEITCDDCRFWISDYRFKEKTININLQFHNLTSAILFAFLFSYPPAPAIRISAASLPE